MQSICDHCLAENPELAKFCHRCGQTCGGSLVRSTTRLTPLMAKWRSLSGTLTRKQVRALLGEPARIVLPTVPEPGGIETWTYEYGSSADPARRTIGTVSILIAESRLLTWVEPEWNVLSMPGAE